VRFSIQLQFKWLTPNRLNGAVILDIAYGYEAKADDDKLIRLAEETVNEFSHAVPPGTFLVDAIPARQFVESSP
jgi:tRNA G10  N-methylase Trm11